jgi:Rv2525c-like, glycoside hydrolase-like domain
MRSSSRGRGVFSPHRQLGYLMSPRVTAAADAVRGRLSPRRIFLVGLLVSSLACAWGATGTALASARADTKLVRYRGYSVVVPASWPVYQLAGDPTVCVRFNRNAVYLGQPGSEQGCPAHSVGRTEAILIEPRTGASGGAHAASAEAPVSQPQPEGGLPSSAQFSISAHEVTVTATWREHPAVVERALGVRNLPSMSATTSLAVHAAAASGAVTRAARVTAGADPVYTGLGFDPCSTPSEAQMSAWRASPYHAVGVYLGGANMACSQTNLTAAWVAGEEAAGWHLIRPTSGCRRLGTRVVARRSIRAGRRLKAPARRVMRSATRGRWESGRAIRSTSTWRRMRLAAARPPSC